MANRRQQQRFKTFGMTSPFGQVTNLSNTGFCLFRKGKMDLAVGQTLRLTIEHAQIQATVDAEVARIERLGLFRHEVGLVFTSTDIQALEDIRRLVDLAQAECIGPVCHLAA